MTSRVIDAGAAARAADPALPSPAAAALHDRAVVVDCHNDLPVSYLTWHQRGGLEYDAIGAVLPRLRAGGVDVQVQPLFIEPVEGEGSLRRVLLLLESLHRQSAAHAGEITICTSGAQVRDVVAHGRVAMVLALEGVGYIGTDLQLLGTLHRLGVRIASLTHLGRTVLADGSREDGAGGRLTTHGVLAVAEMERLGILVDISHLGAASLDHLLEVATRPVVATHSSAWSLRNHHRNLTDDRLRRIASLGGVIAVNFTPTFLGDGPVGLPDIVAHIAHVIDVVGIDHVGLGPDFLAEYFRFAFPQLPYLGVGGLDFKQGVHGMERPEDLPRLTDALLAAGLAEDDVIKVLGGNLLNLFDEVLRA